MAQKNLTSRIKNKYDTAANWTSNNPILLAGEIAIESDTNLIKIGNGTSHWNDLAYVNLINNMSASTSSDIEYLESTGTPLIIDVT